MEKASPVLQFHKALQVAETIWIGPNPDNTFAQLQQFDVDGEWLLEYCGITFGARTEHALPVSKKASRQLFRDHRGSVSEFENKLASYLPPGAKFRAAEFSKYLLGHSGRFNAWILAKTPARNIAVLAKVLVKRNPYEMLLGYPVVSKYRKTHLFFPIIIVDELKVRHR